MQVDIDEKGADFFAPVVSDNLSLGLPPRMA